jgi:hypothetical protein
MHFFITVTRERGHYRVVVSVDGEIEPTTVFGCSERLEPVVRRLIMTQSEYHGIIERSKPGTFTAPPSITFQLPGAQTLTYTLTL